MLLPLLYIPILLLLTKRKTFAFLCLKRERRLHPVTSECSSQDDDNFGAQDDEKEKINWSQKTGNL